MLFFLKHKESILRATHQEQRDAIERLISYGSVHSGYYLLLLLATLIVTPGILINNHAVVIGGMILAPLLIPILLLSLSLLNGTMRGCIESVKILSVSVLISVVTSYALTRFLAGFYVFDGRMVILENIGAGIYILIAFCSGIAAAFAWVKEDLAATLAGVAVAVSLLPPLNLMGVALAVRDYISFENAAVIFSSNLIGISLGAYVVFLLLGFLPSRKMQEKVIEKNHKEGTA